MDFNERSFREAGGRFLPWIGAHYEKSRWGRRVLVLGESHYGDCDSETTRHVGAGQAQRCHDRFGFGVAQVLLGDHEAPRTSCSEVWNEIAFYNYLQDALPRPRVYPDEALWKLAAPPLTQVMESLVPQFVLIFGVRLEDRVRKFNPELWERADLCAVHHPSSSRFDRVDAIRQRNTAFKKAGIAAGSPGH